MIAIILAGGSGTRFWPLSRTKRPKQLVRLFGERVMIAQTFERLARVVSAERVYIVCGEHLCEDILREIPEMSREQLITEPEARDTAAAIALATAIIEARYDASTPVGVFPSDHYIGDRERFEVLMRAAGEVASSRDEIVTLGVKPTRPETGYGYIRRAAGEPDAFGACVVKAFVEKPDADTAMEYLTSGQYLWNAGMFFFTPRTLRRELDRQAPRIARAYGELLAAWGEPSFEQEVARVFASIPSISIDYAVMEGAESVSVLPATFAWSDVGHWAALDEIERHDERGNVVRARVALYEVSDSIFYSTSSTKRIAAVGLEGMIVVDTPNAVMVIPKARAQDVRQIVEMLDEDER